MGLNEETKIRTSRGQIAESEEIVGNLLAALDHYQDIPEHEITSIDLKMMADIRSARNAVIKTYAPENIVNTNFHCLYKHLLLAHTQLEELHQTYISSGEEDKILEVKGIIFSVRKTLNYVRLRYLQISPDDLEDPDCIRCVEDYLLEQKQDEKTKIHGN